METEENEEAMEVPHGALCITYRALQVASYARHAESALENHSGIVTTDVAK